MSSPTLTPVSVVMPAYNARRFLAPALDSVLAQTHTAFELIVIDDGSCDGTLETARDYERRDRRVRVFTQPNRGIAHTLNRAVSLARYEWIARMDADDVMEPVRLARQLAFLSANPDIAVASCLVRYIDEECRPVGEGRSPFTTRQAVARYVRKNRLIAFNHPGSIIRKEALLDVGGYRPEFVPVEDIDLWNRLIERGHEALVQPEFLLRYRVHSQSTVGRKVAETDRLLAWVRHCMIHRRRGEPEPDFETFERDLAAARWWVRLNRRRAEYGSLLYGQAVFSFVSRAYVGAAVQLLTAAALRPGLIADRVGSRLGMWR